MAPTRPSASPEPPPLRRPPPADLAGAIAAYQSAPGPEAADRYLAAAQGVLGRAVKAYGGADTPVVRARAKAIALAAARAFDPARGVKPETYLLTHLQSLRRYGANLAAPVRVPDQVRLDQVRVNRHAEDLSDELGRDPTDLEVADRTGLPLDRVAKARGARAAFVLSATPEGLDYRLPAGAEAARRAWASAVYHDLSPTGRLVLEHTFGLHGKPVLPTGEIARRAGVTAGAVSQHKANIQKLLDEYGRFAGGEG